MLENYFQDNSNKNKTKNRHSHTWTGGVLLESPVERTLVTLNRVATSAKLEIETCVPIAPYFIIILFYIFFL